MFTPTTKVLVVDDFKTMRKLVSQALLAMGLKEVTEAEDAADALPLVESAAQAGQPFGLIVSDWNMPKMQGIEFLKKVRANPATKGTPFLIVTAEAEQKNILEAIQAGVSSYVIKPFNQQTFSEKVMATYKKHNG